MPIEEVHRKLAALNQGKRPNELLEEAWEKICPRVETHVGALLQTFGPLTTHADLLSKAKNIVMDHWQKVYPDKPDAFSYVPRDMIRVNLFRYLNQLDSEHFARAQEHALQNSAKEIPGLDIFLHRYRPDLNIALKGRGSTKLTTQKLREVHDHLVQTALRNAQRPVDLHRQIRIAGGSTDIPYLPQTKVDPKVREELKALRLKQLTEGRERYQKERKERQAQKQAESEKLPKIKKPPQTEKTAPTVVPKPEMKPDKAQPVPAPVKPKPAPVPEKPKPPVVPPIEKKARQAMPVKRYVGITGAYEFVRDNLAHAEKIKNPDLMREARWMDHPHLAPVYKAIKKHVVDGRPFGGHGSWNKMILGKHDCSVTFKLALDERYQ